MMTMSIIYSDASLQRLHSTISINFAEDADRCFIDFKYSASNAQQ